jgi:hypothetical protein
MEHLKIMPRRSYIYKKLVLQAMMFFVLSAPMLVKAEGLEPMTSGELKQLASKIRAAESRITNIKVKAEAWMEVRNTPFESWQRTPVYVSSTAWFDGRPSGKARIEVHRDISEHEQRTGHAYIESSYSMGFDGQYGRIARHWEKNGDTVRLSKSGEVLVGAPLMLRSESVKAFTGTKFSLNFFFDADSDGISTFSEFFELAARACESKTNELVVSREEYQGVECIKFGSGDQKWGHITYWIDPNRGFALLGRESVSINKNGDEQIISRMKANKLKKVAPGVWWPMEASIVSRPYADGKPYRRTVYHAIDVVANAPDFDESVFTVSFPEGYLVEDKVTGRKYKVGKDLNAPKKLSTK